MERRLQIQGVHHVTAIAADAERTIAFYRDLLGLGIVQDGPSDDDPRARHVWFGTPDGALVSFMEYPQLPRPVVGPGATHHFALAVGSAEELEGWREYLRGRGVETTDVLERGPFRSLYLRDPDGHVVELATRRAAGGVGV
jgi:catechol 2,3-dioxygenase-like lactoylglutathione lyase family enzyme